MVQSAAADVSRDMPNEPTFYIAVHLRTSGTVHWVPWKGKIVHEADPQDAFHRPKMVFASWTHAWQFCKPFTAAQAQRWICKYRPVLEAQDVEEVALVNSAEFRDGFSDYLYSFSWNELGKYGKGK